MKKKLFGAVKTGFRKCKDLRIKKSHFLFLRDKIRKNKKKVLVVSVFAGMILIYTYNTLLISDQNVEKMVNNRIKILMEYGSAVDICEDLVNQVVSDQTSESKIKSIHQCHRFLQGLITGKTSLEDFRSFLVDVIKINDPKNLIPALLAFVFLFRLKPAVYLTLIRILIDLIKNGSINAKNVQKLIAMLLRLNLPIPAELEEAVK